MGRLRTHLADEAGRHFGLGNIKGRADDSLPLIQELLLMPLFSLVPPFYN